MKMSPCDRGCGSNPGQHGDIDNESERTGSDDDHDWDQTPGTNAGAGGRMYPYVKTVNVYKCPADQSVVKFGPYSYPKPRSYSMNCWLSPYPGPPSRDATSIFSGSQARIFNKDTDIIQPGPDMTFVLIDESEKSIDDGYFAGSPGLPNYWINVSATRHGGAGGLSFADGHGQVGAGWLD